MYGLYVIIAGLREIKPKAFSEYDLSDQFLAFAPPYLRNEES